MDLLTQLNCAMDFVEENICNDIKLQEVSFATTYSPYHFNRLFYYIAEIPLSEYIRKRKLTLAAMDLQTGNEKVIALAMKYGYDNADSFTRAFSKQHGVTPTLARQSGVNLKIFPPLTFQIKIKGVQEMNWRIEEHKAFEVFGIERIFKNDETDKVPGFWTELRKNGEYERLFQAAGAKRGENGMHCINAVCGYCEPGDDRFPYMICALKHPESKTENFTVAKIPETKWAVFKSDKSDQMGVEIPTLFNRAYSEWLPSSGYDKSNGPDMEIYYTEPDGKHYEEVWIPVVKK